MRLTSYRLDRGSVLLVSAGYLTEGAEAELASVLDQLGVRYAILPNDLEVHILSGPAYPLEIAAVPHVRP